MLNAVARSGCNFLHLLENNYELTYWQFLVPHLSERKNRSIGDININVDC